MKTAATVMEKKTAAMVAVPRIVAVHIFPAWKRGDEARVSAKFSGETSFVRLFSYFSDSLKYTESQLLGKTMEEVMDMRNRGDLESMGKR